MNQDGNSRKLMSELNLTPLVDVMLVVLIIFMVTAPLLMQGVEVNLPETTARHIKTREDPLILTITRKKEIFLEKHKFELETLEEKIRNIFENRREKEILLKADKDVPYGYVIKVIAQIKRAGIDKLGMVTEPVD
ncbi:MAG: protein TolR [Deltaproteobacteria bacterium]|nr:protein TolR [Deltaproteobacteria bacterium]